MLSVLIPAKSHEMKAHGNEQGTTGLGGSPPNAPSNQVWSRTKVKKIDHLKKT
jgi:hypothetical protein